MTIIYSDYKEKAEPKYAVSIAGQYLYSVSKYDVRLSDTDCMEFPTIHGAKCMADAVRLLKGLDGAVVEIDED